MPAAVVVYVPRPKVQKTASGNFKGMSMSEDDITHHKPTNPVN